MSRQLGEYKYRAKKSAFSLVPGERATEENWFLNQQLKCGV